MNWYVVYTKPKGEKKVSLQLQNRDINCYCPVVVQSRQWSDRKKKVEIPLFNSYVFVQLSEENRHLVFDVPGVVRYLFWLGKPAIVRNEEIETIQNWLQVAKDNEVTLTQHQIGDCIQVPTGPFTAQSAVVQDIKNTHYVLVLEGMGCVLKMKIHNQ
ncbi:UpxY family transcription antiterminator [Flavobacterium turcicum]|uniref:UpxY family transcription antiterminator n=1 Tax=Flavobacterium turcicum TaxID=2764718 RepID=A0ABR7JI83_9FLAO|nr:UpxY family transcription antiterminator [Flavobacterium turcicum]MBC5864208.1 UpxY family transcription antiterminator [Flavobacterium turcicum]NHL03116.1 UpxY family transcription antiterminator [Flavobacterium turcicum]